MTLRAIFLVPAVVSRLWAVLALTLLAALLALPAPLRADAGTRGVVHLVSCVTRQKAADDPVRLLADPGRFDCRTAPEAWGPGSYWVRFDLPGAAVAALAADEGGPPRLRFVPGWQRGLVIYTRDGRGALFARWFDTVGLTRMTGIGGAFSVPLMAPGAPVRQVLVKVDGTLNASGILSDPQLLSAAAARRDELIATAIFAAFAGLGVGLLCYNIVLWLTIRERFQLTYCLSLMAMLAYAWSSSGAMATQFPELPQSLRMQTGYVMLAFVGALALQFITDFIEPACLPPRLRRLARHTGLGSLAAAVIVLLAPEPWRYFADRLYVASFLPLPVLVVAVTLTAWRRGSRSVRVLAVAWTVPLLVSLVRIAHALHLVGYGLMVQYALVAAMSVEALLSSLAMSYRLKLITEERDRALADEQAARHLASVDSLTGLLNRRALLEQVIAWQSPEPLRLLLVDIDHFKLINDRHGHLAGDEVLREVAEVLAMRTELRGSVARLGGEEFALIGTAEELHQGIALAILADMRSRPMGGSVNLTVSIGMAEGMVASEDDWRELYRRADTALYAAKAGGRNRAVDAAAAPPPDGAQEAAATPASAVA